VPADEVPGSGHHRGAELGLGVQDLLALVDALELTGFAADNEGVPLTDARVEVAAADA
jgi:hypothetical protein